MNYIPHTNQEIAEMLGVIGAGSVESLFDAIPKNVRAKSFDLPEGVSEFEALDYFAGLSMKNRTDLVCFLGGGVYDHLIPSTVDFLTNKGEFYTAYTPYQPEASQGTLQALYEYQTMAAELMGMDNANASLYDGGTAIAEAALMAFRITRRSKAVIDASVNPLYRQILKTYLSQHECEIVEIPTQAYTTDRAALLKAIDEKTACVIVQNPNFFGSLDDYTDIADAAHRSGALAVCSSYPLALGMIKSPGEMKMDIAVGEGQSLGIPLSFGGPYLGIIATLDKHIRNLPGRIVGKTVDKDNRRAFVLTLQAREQHIRREKATSNICSNQGLCALRALVYLSTVGKMGLAEAAQLCYQKASYLKGEIVKIAGIKIGNSGPTFNEFVVELPKDASEVAAAMAKLGIAAGIPLDGFYPNLKNSLAVAVTEKRTKDELDRYITALKASVLR